MLFSAASARLFLVLFITFISGCARADAQSMHRSCSIAATSSPSTPIATPVIVPHPWFVMEISAYTGSKRETDSKPCRAANGTNICKRHNAGESLCGSNNFPFGTHLLIEGFGECVVVDRMNGRYQGNVDVFFGQDTDLINKPLWHKAMKFGRQLRRVTVINSPRSSHENAP